jgi:hypothetical protein
MINTAMIKAELKAAGKGSKGDIINRYAKLYNTSRFTIYRTLRNEYGASKTIYRQKKIDMNLIHEIAKIKSRGALMGLSERELATDICIQILQEKQFPGADTLTISTVNRRLRELGYRQQDVIVRVEAEYPNQQHQMDFSRSKYFQVIKYDEKANDYLLRVSGKSLYYKEDEHKLRTWLVGITDAFSRVSISRAYVASGECVLIGIEFLNYVYNRPEDDLPIHYLPEILKTDNGSFIKDNSVKALLNKLEIASELSIPMKKRGIQKRESAWKLLWKRFELKRAMILGDGKTIYLNDYNDMIHEFMIELLDRQHPVKACTRGHAYMSGLNLHPQREISIDMKEIIAKPWIRKVNPSLLVSINNDKYECPRNTQNKHIRIYKNLRGEVVAELIDEYSKPFILKPVDGFVTLGNFEHRQQPTYRQVVENEVKQDGKIKYLKPAINKVEPETVFTQAEAENYFKDAYEAKVYAGKILQRSGKCYEDYADVFSEMFSQPDGLRKDYINEFLYYIINQACLPPWQANEA